VAKSYSGREAEAEWRTERNNNVLYTHPRIMPLQASIQHGDKYMNIYPYAEHSLDKLFADIELDKEPKNANAIWGEFKELLSALDHIHASLKGTYGYHFDIKPANILVRNKKWMIADLGLAHCRSIAKGSSQTNRKLGSDEFSPQETSVNRKFDVWGMGCVGCIVMVWLDGGVKAVQRFYNAREHEESKGVFVRNFYCKRQGILLPVVDKMLSAAKGKLSKEVAGILRDMLSYNPGDRPDAKSAEKRFAKVLGVGMTNVEAPRTRRESSGLLAVPTSDMPFQPLASMITPLYSNLLRRYLTALSTARRRGYPKS
jgi:serine/threonine protein kinase